MLINIAKRKKTNEVLLKVDEHLARELQEISEKTGASIQDLLATFIYIGKRSMGRTVIIESKQEQRRIKITALEELSKLTSIEDI